MKKISPSKTKLNLATLITLLVITLLITFNSRSVHAFDAPWDLWGHITSDWKDRDKPGPATGPACGNNRPSPVYILTGDLIWSETDISLAGRPGLSLTRSYNSHDPRDGLFGNGRGRRAIRN